MTIRTFACGLLVAALCSAPVVAGDYVLEFVAQGGDTIDGKLITSVPRQHPIVNDAGDVAFYAVFEGGAGYFINDTLVVAVGEVIDGKTLTTLPVEFDFDHAGNLFFVASFVGGLGIFTQDQLLVESGVELGGKILSNFWGPSSGAAVDKVAFLSLDDGYSIWTLDGQVVKRGDTIDGNSLLFFRRPTINASGAVIFWGGWTELPPASSGEGIFSPESLLVGRGDTIDGRTLVRISDYQRGHSMNGAGEFVFHGQTATGAGIFTQNRLVAEPGTVIDGKTISGFNPYRPTIANGGAVAFSANYTDASGFGIGVFTADTLVASLGDPVGSSGVGPPRSPSINAAGDVAFMTTGGFGQIILARFAQPGSGLIGDVVMYEREWEQATGVTVLYGPQVKQVDDTGVPEFEDGGPTSFDITASGFVFQSGSQGWYWTGPRQEIRITDLHWVGEPDKTIQGLSFDFSGMVTTGLVDASQFSFTDHAVIWSPPVSFEWAAADTFTVTFQTDATVPPPEPPVFEEPSALCGTTFKWAVGKPLEFTVKASDVNVGDSLALVASGLPAGASFTPPAAGNPVEAHFSWTPTDADATDLGASPVTLTFTVTDSTARQATCQFTVEPSRDRDNDGLLDLWEEDGLTAANGAFVDLPAMGANPDHKDLFVYIDWMTSAEYDHQPSTTAMQWIVDSFAAAPVANPDSIDGINLHLMISPTPTQQFVMSLGTGNYNWARPTGHAGPELFLDDFKNGHTDASGIEVLKRHFPEELASTHRYCMFAHQLNGHTASGISRGFPSSDLIVSLGAFAVESGAMPYRPTNSAQAGTFMHEFGHCLGLRHGGDTNTNYKPNYLSVMNYVHQLKGLTKGGSSGLFDYSRAAFPALQENSLDEQAGLAGWPSAFNGYQAAWHILKTDPAGVPVVDATGEFVYETLWTGPVDTSLALFPVDWNDKNGIQAGLIGVSINRNLTGSENLTGYNDWANLDFKGGAVGAGVGIGLPVTTELEELDVETAKKILSPAPRGLAGRSARGMVRLSWIPAGPRGEVTYNVYRALQGEDLEVIATTGSTLFAQRGLPRGEVYDYAVSVIDALGTESELSATMSVLVR